MLFLYPILVQTTARSLFLARDLRPLHVNHEDSSTHVPSAELSSGDQGIVHKLAAFENQQARLRNREVLFDLRIRGGDLITSPQHGEMTSCEASYRVCSLGFGFYVNGYLAILYPRRCR
jgi:hypothetical protein